VKHVAVKGHSLNGARHGIESNRTLMRQASQKREATRMKRETDGKGRSKLTMADDGGLEGDDRAAARESGRDLRRHHDRHLRRLCRFSLQPYAGGGGKSRQQFATGPGRAQTSLETFQTRSAAAAKGK